MTTQVKYAGASNRGLSGNLWKTCDIDAFRNNPELGFFFYDEFLNSSQKITDQNVQDYASYIDTGVTLTQLATATGGVLQVAGNDADNDEGHLQAGGSTGVQAVISDTAGADFELWFEARFRSVTSVADNGVSIFLGLAEEGLTAADSLVDDTGALKTTADFIGFHNLHADGDAMEFKYQKASQAVQVKTSGALALAANTWYKVGFRYQPKAVTAKRIAIFVDNVELTTYVTGTNIAAATFPDAEELVLTLLTKVGAASECKVDLDWWALAQRFTN